MSESYDKSVKWRKRSFPPVIGALVFTVAFIGMVWGFGTAYDDQVMQGAIILGVAAALCTLLIVWGRRMGR